LAAGVKDYVSCRTPRFSFDNNFSGNTTEIPAIISTNAPPSTTILPTESAPTIISTNAPPSTIILRTESAGAKKKTAKLPTLALVPLNASESMQKEVIPKPVATNADLMSIDVEGMDDDVKE